MNNNKNLTNLFLSVNEGGSTYNGVTTTYNNLGAKNVAKNDWSKVHFVKFMDGYDFYYYY